MWNPAARRSGRLSCAKQGRREPAEAGATPLDKVVFVADKIAWDGAGDPPYLDAIMAAVERSLDQAAWCYLDYLWQRRATLAAAHPWFIAAHRQFARLTRLQGAV